MTHAIMFVLLAFGTQGAIVGRTVYVVGAATDQERPYCIALANVVGSVVGLALVLAVGSISQFHGVIVGLLGMGCLNVAAALYVWRLADVHHPEVPGDADNDGHAFDRQ
jgi:hypothetical protein